MGTFKLYKQGQFVKEGPVAPGTRDLFSTFAAKHRGNGCRCQWGHHYRVMKRPTDPVTLILKCKPCKEELHVHP